MEEDLFTIRYSERTCDQPVHLQRDGAVNDGESEHPDPAQQNTPEVARFEEQDEDLHTETFTETEVLIGRLQV